MTPDPTVSDPTGTCGGCHGDIVASNAQSLHTTLAGIKQSLLDRSGETALTGTLQTAFQNHCSKCHGSCGQCHISVPTSAGGGFIQGHAFRRTPSTRNNCVACHGSRVGAEFRGENAGVSADVHYSRLMQCTDCHSADEMHGATQEGVTHRLQVAAAPACEDCHPKDDPDFAAVSHHGLHQNQDGTNKLACQVCHAASYKTCYSCHVSLTAEDQAVYEVNAPTHESVMTFKIGRNPEKSERHPEDWVVLRHVPIDPDNYAHYGANLLTEFDAKPTWRMATPHTIQRVTPQQACATCHYSAELFLTPDDLTDREGNPASYETTANAGVVVEDLGTAGPPQ